MLTYETDVFWIWVFWIVIGGSALLTLYGAVVLARDYLHADDPGAATSEARTTPVRLARPRVDAPDRRPPTLSQVSGVPSRDDRLDRVDPRRI